MHYEIKVHEYFKKQVFEDNIFLIELKLSGVYFKPHIPKYKYI